MDDVPLCRTNIICGRLSEDFYLRHGKEENICPEFWLCKNERVLKKTVTQLAAAGVTYFTVPSYGANTEVLSLYGLPDQTEEINAYLMQMARQAAYSDTVIGGGLGAIRPRNYDDEHSLIEWYARVYKRQIKVLYENGAAYLHLSAMSSLEQIRGGIMAAREFDLPVFVTVKVNDEGVTQDGAELLPCLLTVQNEGAAAFGVEGFNIDDDSFLLLKNIAQYAKIPLIALFNTKTSKPELVKKLPAMGFEYLGESCGEDFSAHINLIKSLKSCDNEQITKFDFRAAANDNEAFFLLDDENLLFSEPIDCSFDLADKLIDLEDESVNVALIRVSSEEDAHILSCNAGMSRLPIAVLTNNIQVLNSALLYFNGIAIISSECEIERSELERIAERYGAIIV